MTSAVPALFLAAAGGSGPLLGSGAPDAFPAPAPGGGSSAIVAVFVILCAAAGAWLWLRARRQSAGLGVRGERRLAVSETRSLGNRQYLVVAAYEGRKFLLGVCPGRIDMLAPLDGEEPRP